MTIPPYGWPDLCAAAQPDSNCLKNVLYSTISGLRMARQQTSLDLIWLTLSQYYWTLSIQGWSCGTSSRQLRQAFTFSRQMQRGLLQEGRNFRIPTANNHRIALQRPPLTYHSEKATAKAKVRTKEKAPNLTTQALETLTCPLRGPMYWRKPIRKSAGKRGSKNQYPPVPGSFS